MKVLENILQDLENVKVIDATLIIINIFHWIFL
jgi:hypothetical protein